MFSTIILALAVAQQPSETNLCGVIETDIEPGHFWREEDITREEYQRTLTFLQERFPAWVDRAAVRLPGEAEVSVFDGQLAWSWLNSLNVITAYNLKLEAQLAPPGQRETAIERFCTFLGDTVIYD